MRHLLFDSRLAELLELILTVLRTNSCMLGLKLSNVPWFCRRPLNHIEGNALHLLKQRQTCRRHSACVLNVFSSRSCL